MTGSAVGFALLGPLEVRVGRVVTQIAGARRRELLTRLLVAANQVVPTDRLIDDLWGDALPDHPVNALQAYVSHLRGVVEPVREGRRAAVVQRRPPGYLVAVEPDDLDATRFARLAAEGRVALREGRPGEASVVLGEALALRRGRPLGEFADQRWARGEVARLEELRWGAVEDHLEAELALGRHAAVVAVAHAAVEQEPLREGLRAQLMLALYRCGRQAEALRAYVDLREVLGNELGIEPSPALVRLEEAVLLQKAELDWVPQPGSARSATGGVDPHDGRLPAPPTSLILSSEDLTRPSRLVDGGLPPDGSGNGGSDETRLGPESVTSPAVAGARRVSSPSFVSRSAELAGLRAALSSAAAGAPALVVVGGEAGVGKTRLVSEFITTAGGGPQILLGRCMEGGGLPFGAVIQALRGRFHDLEGSERDELLGPGGTELARFVPGLGLPVTVDDVDGSAGSGRLRMLESLLGVLERLARSSPLVVVVEDIHWADPSTLELLVFLVRTLRREPILLVVTYRSDDPRTSAALRPFLAEVSRSPLVERLELDRFTREEVVAQLAGILGRAPPPAVAEAIWSRSGGNALFAEELLTIQSDPGSTPQAGRRRGSGLPATLRDILLARIGGLSEEAQAVVRAAAAGGLRVAHPLLAAVAPAGEHQLLAALREAVSHHVLVIEPGEDVYAFRHALLQEVAYRELLPGERNQLHAAYARTLTAHPELGPDPSVAADVANHWFAAGDLTQALAAAVAAGAADEARYGFIEARRHFERALGIWMSVPDASSRAGLSRVELLQRTAQTAFLSGDHAGAAALTTQALDLVPPADEPARAGMLQERMGRYLWAAGGSEAALRAYERAAVLVPAEPASGGRARILAAQGQALMLLARYRESSLRCEEAITVAKLAGDRPVEGHARNTLGYALGCLGRADAGVAELRHALRIAEEAQDLDDHARALLNLTELLAGPTHRLQEALAVAAEGREATARLGLDRDYGVSLRAITATVLHSLGRWAEAERLLLDAVNLDPLGMANIDLQLGLARVLVTTGRFNEARERLDTAGRLCVGAVDPQVHAPCSAMRAELALWEARPEQARQAVAQGLGHLEHTDDSFFTAPLLALGLRAEADLAAQARSSGLAADLEEATAAGHDLLERARALLTLPSPGAAVGYARTCEAELRRLQGRPDPDLWARAARSWEELALPYPAAQAHWRHGEGLLQAHASQTEIVQVLAEAGAIAERIGAHPLQRAIRLLTERVDRAVKPGGGGSQAPTLSSNLGCAPDPGAWHQHGRQ